MPMSVLNMAEEKETILPRADPLCPVFGECGGCCYQDIAYDTELEIKAGKIRGLLEPLMTGDGEIEAVVPSPDQYHYRHRLDFKAIKTKRGELLLGYTPLSGQGIVPVDNCPLAAETIYKSMPLLQNEIRERWPADYRRANVVIRCGGDERVFWGGVGHGTLKMKADDYLFASVNGKNIYYSMDTFFQANFSILPALFEKIVEFSVFEQRPFLFDLYGGVGLFTFGLMDHCSGSCLVESDVHAVRLARYNKDVHRYDGCTIIESPVEETLSEKLSVASGEANVAIIDPPRAGLSEGFRDFISRQSSVRKLFYLSCMPESLARDLAVFVDREWQIKKVIPFDFFPKTKHIETLVYLERP